MKTYDSSNFHKHTFCLWKEVTQADFEQIGNSFTSKSGSAYFFTDSGVYRISNHWGRVANCRWRLMPLASYSSQQLTIAYAEWNDFFPNDETAKLYFVAVDWNQKKADFFHKNVSFYDGKALLRTAVEASGSLKIIKRILQETDWAKHVTFEDLEALRHWFVSQLLTSSQTFVALKRKYVEEQVVL